MLAAYAGGVHASIAAMNHPSRLAVLLPPLSLRGSPMGFENVVFIRTNDVFMSSNDVSTSTTE